MTSFIHDLPWLSLTLCHPKIRDKDGPLHSRGGDSCLVSIQGLAVFGKRMRVCTLVVRRRAIHLGSPRKRPTPRIGRRVPREARASSNICRFRKDLEVRVHPIYYLCRCLRFQCSHHTLLAYRGVPLHCLPLCTLVILYFFHSTILLDEDYFVVVFHHQPYIEVSMCIRSYRRVRRRKKRRVAVI